jgi:hypothetical protein
MIKFFRKIRQNLVMENPPPVQNGKTSRYIKYAIGEIVLVVLGILIALQINNWNSIRQIQSNNKVFLNKMLSELEQNKARMNWLAFSKLKTQNGNISLEQAIRNCDSLLKLTYRGLHVLDLDFILNKQLDAGGSYLNLHNSIYEELINTGKLYTLGSDSLINAIKNYYKRCEREDLYNKANTENMDKGMELMRDGLKKLELDFKMDSVHFNIDNYPWFFERTSEKYQNLQIGLELMVRGQTANFNKMNQIIQYSDSLIVKIKTELKNYHD